MHFSQQIVGKYAPSYHSVMREAIIMSSCVIANLFVSHLNVLSSNIYLAYVGFELCTKEGRKVWYVEHHSSQWKSPPSRKQT